MKASKNLFILILTVITFAAKAHIADPVEKPSTEIISLEKVPLVALILNGQRAYFVLDSGADVSLLHITEAGNFGFTHKKAASKSIIGSSGGKQPLFQAAEVDLQIDQQTLQTSFYATDLSSVVKSLANSTGITISGIIGMDLMRRYGFEIDYLNQRLTLNSSF